MQITIGGSAVGIQSGSLQIDDAIGERSTCSFVVKDELGTGHYQKGQPVVITDDSGVRVFGGVIDSAKAQKHGTGSLLYHSISCADWHYLADKRIAVKSYEEMLAGDIVADLLSSYLQDEGVSGTRGAGGTIQDGPTIRQAVMNYRPVTEALDALAEKAGYIWYIDAEKVLHFVERSTYAAPWMATADDMYHGSVSVEHANPRYRNRQYIKGGRDTTDPQTETRKGDDSTQAFALGFPMAKEPTVKVDGVTKTVGVKGTDTGKDWYWSKGDPVLKQDWGATPLTLAQTLEVTYQGEYDIVVLSEDSSAVVDRQSVENGGTGYVEDVADEPDATNREAGFESANAKLKQYATIGRRLRFQTGRTGLRPGQLLTVDLPEHNLNNAEMLVESVAVSDENGQTIWHDVVAVEGPEQGSWSRMFAAMATRGRAFVERVNIGEDQVLIVLHSFQESWPWAENLGVNVFSCPVPSTALYPDANTYPC